ncbi:MAG: hypothetical protein ACREBA_00285 [Nitrosotalea sp.]
MFKNHDESENLTLKLNEILSQNQINSILYSDPFVKAGFISKLVSEVKTSVLYLDLDLLYSGYVVSGTIHSQDNLILYQPSEDTISDILTEILVKASMSQVLVVIDSINGLFNMLHQKKDVGKVVASIIVLLASIARLSKSYVIISSMARYRKEEGWILSPTGKRFIETKNSKKILLEQGKEGIIASLLDDSNKLLIPANSIPI